jgi:hypothetical protein
MLAGGGAAWAARMGSKVIEGVSVGAWSGWTGRTTTEFRRCDAEGSSSDLKLVPRRGVRIIRSWDKP